MTISDATSYAGKLASLGLHTFESLFFWLVGVGILFVVLERLWAGRRQQAVLREGLREDVALYFIGGLIPPAVGALVAGACLWLSTLVLPQAWFDWLASWPLMVSVALVILLGELTYYWAHRLSHEIPWLWKFHALHHSPTEMDWLVNTRAHPLDLVFSHVISATPLLLLGLKQPDSPSVAPVLVGVVVFNVMWAFFVHSNCRLRFGPFEYLLTTPAFHHWHHANDDPSVINKNYAAVLPWFDKLFGTWYLPQRYPAVYGINERLPESIGGLLAYPFKRRS